ncbi:MAG TPA: hypothetical protein VE174_02065 [Actinomycetota bacterium]|nr:hypothetical protein [Actinomycetota bacterium]
MKGSTAVFGSGHGRTGSRLGAVTLIAIVSILLLATFGARPAMADPKDKDDKGSSSSDNGNSANAPGHSEDKAEAKEDKAEAKAEAKEDKAEAKEDKAEDKADDDDAPAHCTDGNGNDGNANKHCSGDDDDGVPAHCTDGRGNDGNANKHCQGGDNDNDSDRDSDSDSDSDTGAVAAPAAPASNQSKGRPLVLGSRLSRAPAVAPAVVRGGRSGAALPFTGSTALIPFVALGLALMGSGSYLCSKKH